jgi:aminodeoxyfutalosine deaminase
MKRIAAQYVITNIGEPLKRAVITTEDDGTIISIEETNGNLEEKHSTEFYNGIIIPGFVNCHCHLELSHMKGSTTRGTGLSNFIEEIRRTRDSDNDRKISSAKSADSRMYNEGTVLCADICNTSDSFSIKKNSRISYINFLEVFGLDPEKAIRRMDEINQVADISAEMGLPKYIVPHSAYSVSLTLFKILRDECSDNKVTSIHFMESEDEILFLKNLAGPMMQSYEKSGILPRRLETVRNHADAVLNEITSSGNLILVHNTFTDLATVRMVSERDRLYWCMCPNSNLYIEKKIAPLNILLEENCTIVIGTDSLASNNDLSILEELKTLQIHFPEITLEDLISWATINGARALGAENLFGKIEPGKKPGLLLLQNADLQNMKLLPESSVTRLI